MFFHDLKYDLLSIVRTKAVIFWLLIFPIALGSFFKIAFDGIYDKTTKFNTVPVAVVSEDENVKQAIDSVSEGEEPLFKPTYVSTLEEAEKLLRDGEVKGILTADSESKLSVTVASKGIDETIIKAFADSYELNRSIIMDAVESGSFDKLDAISTALTADAKAVSDIDLTNGSTDNLAQYFYNLLAMTALYGMLLGLNITILNQANLSNLGMRRQCSPRKKSYTLLVSLCAAFIAQSVCMVVAVTFVRFALGIDLGERLGLVYLTGIVGGLLGVCFGFAVGSVGRGSYDKKMGILMSIVMLLCFLSGLMVGNMKAVVEQKAPWFNKINPAAVISDSFYCLVLYDDLSRYLEKLITMLVISAVFVLAGFALTRRRKYESL
ncbi:MAG: ABC transporter permease [Ruminococcus sp.]|nr:ABC transporter permease [Ruminococcus sp.]